MANVSDVAQYILQEKGMMTAMKLQKLVYYCQAWNVVWEGEPLFPEAIEAWTNGPVVRALYDLHKGCLQVACLDKGDATNLTPTQKENIDIVIRDYGDKPAQWLGDLAHMEQPWIDARNGVEEGMPCTNEITLESLNEYYGSLLPSASVNG